MSFTDDWGDEDDDLWQKIVLEDVNIDTESNKRGSSCSESKDNQKLKLTKLGSNPLTDFRHGYLWVSDIVTQMWCEQQMHYGFIKPMIPVQKPEMVAGTDLHLAREKEVQDSVQVKVTSDEDIFAIKLINLYSAVKSLLTSQTVVCREIPIFGSPFDNKVFMIGLIDEIRVDPETFNWEILELKTRKIKSVPNKAQKSAHQAQVMLYKKLFDDLVGGKITKEMIEYNLEIDFEARFGKDVEKHIKASGLKTCIDLNELWNILQETMQAVPMISQLFIEYCFQEDKSTIAIEPCEFDEAWLKKRYDKCVEYWQGNRAPEGVDIEEAWKCQRCDFTEDCEWREKKAEEHRKKNVANYGT